MIWSWENALETVGWLYIPPSLSLYNNFLGQTSVWLGRWRPVHFVSPAGPPQATLRQEAAERSEALKLREKEPLGKQWTSTSNSNNFSSSNFPSQAAKLPNDCYIPLVSKSNKLFWLENGRIWNPWKTPWLALRKRLQHWRSHSWISTLGDMAMASNQGMTSTANLVTSSHHISSSIFGLIIREP